MTSALLSPALRRTGLVAALSAGALVLSAGGAFAHECVNASKSMHQPGAGVQVLIDTETEEAVWVSDGVQKRIDQGLIDFETGEGFSGLVGFDFDGDGAADLTTFIVGPEDEVPEEAQEHGAACAGVVNIGDYFACISG
jgi:hypothetical protein